MLLSSLICCNVLLMAAAMMGPPPPPPPIPRYKDCPKPDPRNPFEVIHSEHGCWNLFSGVGILSDLIPAPPAPPPRMAITTTIIAQPLRNQDNVPSGASDKMAHKIGNGMQRAFSMGARNKRGLDDEPWYKKGQASHYNSGRKTASRAGSRSDDSGNSLFNFLPMPPPPFAPAQRMPVIDMAVREEIDKKVCKEWRKQAMLVVAQGSLSKQCCQLDCYCKQLETGDKSTCGGHVHPPPPPPFFAPPPPHRPTHMGMRIPIQAMSTMYGSFPSFGGMPFYPPPPPPPQPPQQHPSMYPYRAPTGSSSIYTGAFPTSDDSQPKKQN